jgi:hypothetical protein
MEIKTARVTALLPQAFAWAREMNPAQPLTSGVYELDTSAEESALEPIERIQLHESDIITFHNYSWPESFQAEIAWLRRFHRPVVCSKSMARSVGSTFDGILPIANQERVGASNWDSSPVKRKTYYPWESGQHPYIRDQPPVCFTRCCALTERSTGKQKWISSDNLRENNSSLPEDVKAQPNRSNRSTRRIASRD